jgi:hypothetical protein
MDPQSGIRGCRAASILSAPRVSTEPGALEQGSSALRAYASKRRKIVTAFWPPKPKPLIATVSTLASRATSGT